MGQSGSTGFPVNGCTRIPCPDLCAKGEWQFAPAYDLTFSYSGYGFHSTMIAGESKNPGRKELMKLATHFGLKNAGLIIEEVQEAINQWGAIASEYGISRETRNTVQTVMDKIRD